MFILKRSKKRLTAFLFAKDVTFLRECRMWQQPFSAAASTFDQLDRDNVLEECEFNVHVNRYSR